MVRDCNCHPVLRGILESLLHYLTQDLPKWTVQDRNLKKPWTDWNSKMIQDRTAERFSETPEINKLQNSDGGTTSRNLVPRHLTTFRLLHSKFTRSSSKAPITHQREVGTLSTSRGAPGDLKNFNGKEPEPKSKTRRGQGQKKGGSVKDIVAKFAMVERKEKAENTLKNQLLKAHRTGRGAVLSTLMQRFETVATVCKGSAVAQVRLPSDVKQMVACRERRQRGGEDQNVHNQNQPRKMKIKSDLKGYNSNSGRKQTPELKVPKIKSNQDVNHFKRPDQRPEDHCSSKTIKHQSLNKTDEKSAHHGEILSRPEECNITAHLKYARLEVFSFKSVIEECLPQPYKLLPQVEAQTKCHVGMITTSSPVWSTCVDHSPKLHPAGASETTMKPPTGASESSSCSKGGAEDYLNSSKTGEGQKMGPTYLIPRVYGYTFPQDAKDHPLSFQLPAANSEMICLNAEQPAHVDTSDTGPLARPPGNTEKRIVHATIKETQMEDNLHGKGEAKEPTPVVTEDTDMQQSEETMGKAASEDGTTSDVSSSEGHRKTDCQELRPKYKTINYGDPSVKLTYKPKIIRFTDTFTF